MTRQFKLVPKMQENLASIYLVLPSENMQEIVRVLFPNDHQVNDNCEALDDIILKESIIFRTAKKNSFHKR